MNKSCGDGTCATDTQKHIGRGAFCSEPKTSLAPLHEGGGRMCDFTQEVGQKCSILIQEGDRLCDKTCKDLVRPLALRSSEISDAVLTSQQLVCHNGTMEVAQECAHGVCLSDKNEHLGKAAYCLKNKTLEEPGFGLGPDQPISCGPIDDIGADCGNLIKEGWRICDSSCSNIVILTPSDLLGHHADLSTDWMSRRQVCASPTLSAGLLQQ